MEEILYDMLTSWFRNKMEHAGDKRPTFVVTVIGEDDDSMAVGAGIVDPDLPEDIEMPPINHTMAQQTAVCFLKHSEEILDRCKAKAEALTAITKIVGKDKMKELVKKSNSYEDFKEELSKYGITLIDGEEGAKVKIKAKFGVEKHGTGIH